jgi:glyoxylase-like metal-dependent hydrolase (beta-lactamase superfamily II)
MKVHELRLSVTTCYLIETGGRYILIDTGYESDWELFLKRLKEVDVSLSDISHLVLTHHHDDHCGLLAKVTQANQDIRIVMFHGAKKLLAQGHNDRSHGVGYVSRRVKLLMSLMQGLDKEFAKQWRTHNFPRYAVRACDILIEHDTDLDEIGIDLKGKLIDTPGHTTDSISLLLDDGTSFVGDAAANFLQFAGTKYCVIAVEDIDEYYQSWRKLISCGAQRILPAHGKPFAVEELSRHMGEIKRSAIVQA